MTCTAYIENRSSTISSGVPGPTPASTHHDGDYSTSGAFKGTGLIPYLPDRNGETSFLLFQHYTGQIRQLKLDDNGLTWAEGSSSDVVVGSDVRNATPIAVGSYETDNISWVPNAMLHYHKLMTDLTGIDASCLHRHITSPTRLGSIERIRWMAERYTW